jgi:hypothetical protein
MSKLAAKMSQSADRAATLSDSKNYRKTINEFCKSNKAGERRIALQVEKGYFRDPGQGFGAKFGTGCKKNKDVPADHVVGMLKEAEQQGPSFRMLDDATRGNRDANHIMCMCCEVKMKDTREEKNERSVRPWKDAMIQKYRDEGHDLLRSVHLKVTAPPEIDWLKSGIYGQVDARNFRNKLTGDNRKLAAPLPANAQIQNAWDVDAAKITWTTADGLESVLNMKQLFAQAQRQVPP